MHHPHLARPLLLLLSLALLPRHAHAARVLDHYDLDSLCALAPLIVQTRVGDPTAVQTRDGNCTLFDVTVLSTFQGDTKPQSVLRVAGLDVYHKGPGLPGVADKTRPRISTGDVVYLFLVPKGTRMGYAMYDLSGADWKVIESGARLVSNDHVYAFGQPSGIGAMGSGFTAMTPTTFPGAPVPTIEAFEQRLRKSIDFVRDLRRKLTDRTLTPAEREAILKTRGDVLRSELARTDHIPTLIARESRRAATQP